MAIPKQPSITFLLLAIVTLSFTTTSIAADCSGTGAGSISAFWGANSEANEGTLESVCSTGDYDIVILSGLTVFDDGSTPELDLADHCDTDEYPCSKLETQIEYCQENNIKVFLSIDQYPFQNTRNRPSKSNHGRNKGLIRGPVNTESYTAEKLASYLLDNYLSGQPGPLGKVSLDGINIADDASIEKLKWDEVVKAINASTTARKIYLSAAPQCMYPDYNLDTAISTGLFDYIWVQFFDQSCIYENGDATNLLKAWSKWTKNVPKSSIFLGLVSFPFFSGYIAPEALASKVLPTVKQASNYGGVTILVRSNDLSINYTAQIKDSVRKGCRCVCDGDDAFASQSFYGLGSATPHLSV